MFYSYRHLFKELTMNYTKFEIYILQYEPDLVFSTVYSIAF